VLLCSLSVSPSVAMQVFGSLADQQGAQPLSAAGVNTGSGVQPLPARQRTAASVQVQLNCSPSQVLCCRSACHSSTLLQATCLVDTNGLPCHPLSSCHVELAMPKRGIKHDIWYTWLQKVRWPAGGQQRGARQCTSIPTPAGVPLVCRAAFARPG